MRALILLLLTGCSSGFAPHHELNNSLFINHTYISDQRQHGKPDVWQKNCKVGDCEDISLCMMQKLGSQSRLVICENQQGGHAIVKHNGWYYDPTYGKSGKMPPCRVIFSLSYNQAMAMSGTSSSQERLAILETFK